MICQLTHRALLKLSGKDVQSFLQGQFSNDIDALEENKVQINAYCQHQGKIIALIWVMRQADSFYLSFPSDLTDVAVKRLTMFKMMSDVSIIDVTADVIQLGVIDEGLPAAFKLNAQQSIVLADSLDGVALTNEAEWNKACIENSVPEVHLKTSEKLVPQMLNLDIDELGVSFTKGCYPGQEVVARLHYLGKSKRRMFRFECEGDISVGDKLIVVNSESAKASGVVVRCVKLANQSLCLATLEVEYKDDEVHLNDARGLLLSRI